jgi:hypothetical protein
LYTLTTLFVEEDDVLDHFKKLAQNPHDFWMVGEPTNLPSFAEEYPSILKFMNE